MFYCCQVYFLKLQKQYYIFYLMIFQGPKKVSILKKRLLLLEFFSRCNHGFKFSDNLSLLYIFYVSSVRSGNLELFLDFIFRSQTKGKREILVGEKVVQSQGDKKRRGERE